MRIMLPISRATNNRNENANKSFDLQSRNSNSSSGSTGLNGLIVVEYPIVIKQHFKENESSFHTLDEPYLSLMGRRVCNLDDSNIRNKLVDT